MEHIVSGNGCRYLVDDGPDNLNHYDRSRRHSFLNALQGGGKHGWGMGIMAPPTRPNTVVNTNPKMLCCHYWDSALHGNLFIKKTLYWELQYNPSERNSMFSKCWQPIRHLCIIFKTHLHLCEYHFYLLGLINLSPLYHPLYVSLSWDFLGHFLW